MRRTLSMAALACSALVACQALLDLEDDDGRTDGGADVSPPTPNPTEGGALVDTASVVDVIVPSGLDAMDAGFSCPAPTPTTFCTDFEGAVPHGSWPKVDVSDKATLIYDVIDGGSDAGTTMLITTLDIGAIAQLRADDVLSRFLHCEVDWNVEATSPTSGAFALVSFQGGFNGNPSAYDIRLDIDTTRSLTSNVETETRSLAGGMLGWNHTLIDVDRGDGDAGSASLVVTLNGVVNFAHPLPSFERFNSIRVGPDYENGGWRLRYDNVLCRGSN